MGRARAAVFVASIAVVAAACASLEGLTGGTSDDGDAAVVPDAALDVDAAPRDPCLHATFPAPPAQDDDPTTELPPVVLAVRNVSVNGAIDGGAPLGFDLDGVCTCFPDPSTAHEGKPSCAPPDGSTVACDADGGVDRQLANLLAGYPQLFTGKSADEGGPSVVLKLTKYNGRANDSEVFAAAFGSEGIYDVTDCPGDDAGPPYRPTWKGCDRWSLDSQYVLPGTTEPTGYLAGYVTNHVLVVKGNAKSVAFITGNTSLPISASVMMARLVPLDANLAPIDPAPEKATLFRIDEGVVTGRITTTEALRGLAGAQAASDSGPLCGFDKFFKAVKENFVCPNADINGSTANDFTNASCDAISVAAAFAAEPAQLGAVRKATKPPCADPKDPSFDALFDCSK